MIFEQADLQSIRLTMTVSWNCSATSFLRVTKIFVFLHLSLKRHRSLCPKAKWNTEVIQCDFPTWAVYKAFLKDKLKHLS